MAAVAAAAEVVEIGIVTENAIESAEVVVDSH